MIAAMLLVWLQDVVGELMDAGDGVYSIPSAPVNPGIGSDVGLTLRWRKSVPPGYSSPVLRGEQVIVTAADDDDLLTMALNRQSGELLWIHREAYDGKLLGENTPATPTPISDGSVVFCLFQGVGVIALGREGDVLWRSSLGELSIPHGLSSTPVLWKDRLLVQVDQDGESFLLALNKNSGEPIWKTPRDSSMHGYSSPALSLIGGAEPQLILSESMRLTSYSLATGKRGWSIPEGAWEPKSSPVIKDRVCYFMRHVSRGSRPPGLALGDTWEEQIILLDADGDGVLNESESEGLGLRGQLFGIADLDTNHCIARDEWAGLRRGLGARSALIALRFSVDAENSPPETMWSCTNRRVLSEFITPLLHEGNLFLIKDGGMMSVLDASNGSVLSQARIGLPDRYYASPVGLASNVLFSGLSGQLLLVSGRKGWTQLGSMELGEPIWSTPLVIDDSVFIRTQEALWCFGLRSPEQE